MLSEGSSVKGSPEDKQESASLYQGKCQDFMAGDSGLENPTWQKLD